MRILYQNTFDTTAQLNRPLVVASGGGQVLHSGSALRIVCPSGADCTWWSADYDAPHAYVLDRVGYAYGEESEVATSGVTYVASGVVGSGQITGGGAGIVWGECRITTASPWMEDDEPKSGLILYEDVDDTWKLAYNHAQQNITLQKIVNGSATTVETTAVSGVNDPNVAPLRLRLYVNKHGSRTILNDRNTAMSPGQVAAYYSDTDGVLWTKVGSNQSAGINVDAAGFGVFTKRSSATPTTDAWVDFDSFRIAINEAHELFYASRGKDGDAEAWAWEDDLAYWYNPSAVTGDTTSSGILDKKPGRFTSDGNNYQGKSAWEDDLYYAFDRLIYPSQRAQGVKSDADHGGVSAWEDNVTYDLTLQRNPGQIDENDNHHQSKQVWEDSIALTFDPAADWQDGVTDGDGKDFVQGYSFGSMMYYDTTSDPWHSPTQSGFYGVGRDGLQYYNGTPTELYEPIATSASGVNQLGWSSNDNPMPGYWPGHGNYYDISYPAASGELRIATNQPLTGWQSAGVSSAGRWTLAGDFDIQVGFKNLSESGGSGGGFDFEIVRDDQHRVYIERRYDNYIGTNFQDEGSWSSHHTEYYTTSNSIFRFTRSGSNVQAYFWRGYWDAIGAVRNFGGWNCFPRVRVTGTGNLTISVTAYDFRVNSGSFARTAGWYREGDGTHRGLRNDFPERFYLISSQDSLNIIDADNNKLWMRFSGGSNNAYHNGDDRGITDMSFHDGVLWVSCTGPENHGHVHRIDFNTEDCRYVTNSDTAAFGRYLFQSGQAYWGYQSAIGGIRDRNGNNGFNGDFPNWALPGNRCYSVSVAHDSNIAMETVAIATSGGVVVHYYNRWKFGEWDGIEYHNQYATNAGNQAFWCHIDRDTKDLYWLNKTHFCYTLRDTYHAALNGSVFATTTAKQLPTRLGRWEQYHMVQHGGYFYLATKDGVYRITGPTGEWQLVFGKPSSSALSKIITEACDGPVRLALHRDGSIDLLMISVDNVRHGWTQVIFARLDTLALYAKSRLITGRTGQPQALVGKWV